LSRNFDIYWTLHELSFNINIHETSLRNVIQRDSGHGFDGFLACRVTGYTRLV